MDGHPIDRLLLALSDGTRRLLLERLRREPGLTLSALVAGGHTTRQAVSKHLAVLESVGLVATLWRGREKLHYFNPEPLRTLPARWVTADAREAKALSRVLERALAAAKAGG